MTIRANLSDARHLKNLDTILDKPILGAFVISEDAKLKYIRDNNILFLPAAYAFGASGNY